MDRPIKLLGDGGKKAEDAFQKEYMGEWPDDTPTPKIEDYIDAVPPKKGLLPYQKEVFDELSKLVGNSAIKLPRGPITTNHVVYGSRKFGKSAMQNVFHQAAGRIHRATIHDEMEIGIDLAWDPRTVSVVKGRHHNMNNNLDQQLDFLLQKGYNVLLEGEHGVGKTAQIMAAFKRAKLRYIMLSGATMDPFIDFVGVPVKVEKPNGESVIQLVRPEYIVDINPQAIFVDEFNRSHKKVRNAVMELIQFKTINGVKMGNDLRVVWAAINPDTDEAGNGVYDTDHLDPAQRDRFQVQITLPFQCDQEYFNKKYTAALGVPAVEFWRQIPENLKRLVSPRRLDYAVQMFKDGGDLRSVLPSAVNPHKLQQALSKQQTIAGDLSELLDDPKKATEFMKDQDNFFRVIPQMVSKEKYRELLNYAPKEFIVVAMGDNSSLRKRVLHTVSAYGPDSPFWALTKEIIKTSTNTFLVEKCRVAVKQFESIEEFVK